jgi:hypothetical protein
VACRVVVATHAAEQNGTEEKKNRKKTVGVARAGVVYELFYTNLPQQGCTACDVVELYLHRGAFEPVLSDEDQEIDPDRWCRHSAWGQEAWQCIAQWVWNLRLELGHQLKPEPVRTTQFAPALDKPEVGQAPAQGYGPPVIGRAWKTGRYSGQDFALRPDGTVRCPAEQTLLPHEYRREAAGSLRVVYGASLRSCRPCPLRDQCQWQGNATAKPRQGSRLLHPLAVGTEPLLWQDWGRRSHRRACLYLLRQQRVEIQVGAGNAGPPAIALAPLSRAERAHTRLSWQERLARNERTSATQEVTIKLFGVPQAFALWLGLLGQ